MRQSGASINPIILNGSYDQENSQEVEISNVTSAAKPEPDDENVAGLEILPPCDPRKGLCKKSCGDRQQNGKDNMCGRHYTSFKSAGIDIKTCDEATESTATSSRMQVKKKKMKKKRALRKLETYNPSPKKTRSHGRIRPKRGIDH